MACCLPNCSAHSTSLTPNVCVWINHAVNFQPVSVCGPVTLLLKSFLARGPKYEAGHRGSAPILMPLSGTPSSLAWNLKDPVESAIRGRKQGFQRNICRAPDILFMVWCTNRGTSLGSVVSNCLPIHLLISILLYIVDLPGKIYVVEAPSLSLVQNLVCEGLSISSIFCFAYL